MRRTLRALLTTVFSVIAPALVIVAIWLPEFLHYYVPSFAISDDVPEMGRRIPDEALLEELRTFLPGFLLTPSFRRDEELIVSAEKLLQGDVDISGFPQMRIHIPFSPGDLDKGSPEWQLALAGFLVPEVLLRAYQITGRDQFLLTARDVIQAWALYERYSWLPKGFLWNDHAMAARVPVLAEFWRVYRKHPAYEHRTAKALFQFLARSAYLLAKPSHFTFATNHGVIQNLALWHLSLAFPILPNVEKYRQTALDRLLDQMRFYIGDEGVVLEHSAGYHRVGLELLGMGLRYLTLMEMPIPRDWVDKYQRALHFYVQLRRPDGSLPLFGDTPNRPDPTGPLMTRVSPAGQAGMLNYRRRWMPQASHTFYPEAGYSIWWRGLDKWPNTLGLSQAVVAWSHFSGHGHKHADEMSVLLWAAGQTWWTNVGYWPYGLDGRSQAESWSGSNAPHLSGEPLKSPRHTELLSFGWSDDVAAIHLERRGPDGYVARRQLIYLKPNVWLVVDHTSGAGSTTTQWTTAHDVTLQSTGRPGSYYLRATNGFGLTTFLLTSPGTTTRVLRGSSTPFGGWQVVEGVSRPTYSILVEQPAANSWAVAIWCLRSESDPALKCPEQASLQHFASDEDWSISLSGLSPSHAIWRTRLGVHIGPSSTGRSSKEILLTRPDGASRKSVGLKAGYETALHKYPKFQDLTRYRAKVTYMLISVVAVQELFFVVYRKIGRKHYAHWRILSLPCWATVAAWLLMFHFRQ